MTMGVYCIQVEKESYWQSYVGISKNIEERWREHKIKLRKNCHVNQYLQNTWNKYNEFFQFHILETVDNYKDLYQLEKDYAYSFGYGDYDLCFNIGTPGEKSPMLGRKHTEETKTKLSVLGKKHMTGKKHSEEAKQKMSEAKKGKKASEETKEKMSKAQSGAKHYNAKLTEEEARFILTVKEIQKNQQNREFTKQQLADHFQVSIHCITDIMVRKSWKRISSLSIQEYEKIKQEIINKQQKTRREADGR